MHQSGSRSKSIDDTSRHASSRHPRAQPTPQSQNHMSSILAGDPSEAELSLILEKHEMYKMVLEGNYRGPVRNVLSATPRNPRPKALDIGNSSPWLLEMALEFPHVEWTGVDLVSRPHPQSPPHVHIKYEAHDFTSGLRYRDATFDLVHARNTFQMVANYPHFIREIRRILKPGGILLWADTQINFFLTSRVNPATVIPGCYQLQLLQTRLLSQNHGIDISRLPQVLALLRNVGGFRMRDKDKDTSTGYSHSVICVPNGDWDKEDWMQQEIGLKSRQSILSYLMNIGPTFRATLGLSEEEVTELIRKVHSELSDPEIQSFHHYHTIFAVRDND